MVEGFKRRVGEREMGGVGMVEKKDSVGILGVGDVGVKELWNECAGEVVGKICSVGGSE